MKPTPTIDNDAVESIGASLARMDPELAQRIRDCSAPLAAAAVGMNSELIATGPLGASLGDLVPGINELADALHRTEIQRPRYQEVRR